LSQVSTTAAAPNWAARFPGAVCLLHTLCTPGAYATTASLSNTLIKHTKNHAPKKRVAFTSFNNSLTCRLMLSSLAMVPFLRRAALRHHNTHTGERKIICSRCESWGKRPMGQALLARRFSVHNVKAGRGADVRGHG
jgi:hypothetical protein